MIKGSSPFFSNFYSQGFKGLGRIKIAPSSLKPLKFRAEDEPKSPTPPELPPEKSSDIIAFTQKEALPKDASITKVPEETHPATIPFESVPSPQPAQSMPDIKLPTNEIIEAVFPFHLPPVQINKTNSFIKSPKPPSDSSTSQFHLDPFSLKFPTSKANESKKSKKIDPLKPKMEPLANISSKDPLPPEILSLESAKHFDLFPSKNDITLAKPLYPTFPKPPPTEIIPFNTAKHFKSRLPKELEAIRKGLLNGTLPESEMLEATPNLLLNQPLDVLNKVIRAVEYFFDADKESRGFHPNEAELLLLLNHPALLDRNPKNTTVMTQVLTSITRFIKTPTVQLTDRA
ncbi:MAG: hypothetical protein K2X66_04935, partial [Cyanobacteria bacterium]|nr:hypothetical protein [Cyanobacteriota bacterium]